VSEAVWGVGEGELGRSLGASSITYQGGRNTTIEGGLGLLGSIRGLNELEVLSGLRVGGRHGGEVVLERDGEGS
jgi:hypothetical protein